MRYRIRDLKIEEPAIETIVRHLYEAAALESTAPLLPTGNEIETV